MTLPAPLQVFIGGAIGGALRLGIDAAYPAGTHGIPWDILAINIVGSFALGVIACRAETRGPHPYFPMLGTGVLGGFTTFSAVAALHWTADTSLWLSAMVLALTLASTTLAAGLGWAVARSTSHAVESAPNLVENVERESGSERPQEDRA
jgi:CrcB protein